MKNDVKITVFDTPGLADATGQDEEYLRKIQEKESKFDLFLFCTELNTVRFRNDDFETMKKLTSTLGLQLWDHGVVVFTFANEVRRSPSKKAKNVSEKDFFSDRFRGFKRKIQESLVNLGVPEEVAVNVPFVPAGDLREPRLPDRDNWLTAFWVAAFKRINRKAKSAFLIANADRFSFTSDLANVVGELASGESKKNCDSSHTGPSPEEVDAMKALKQKLKKISFEKQLGSSLLKGRVHDEEGNKTSLQNDQDVKLTEGTAIEMDESASPDLIQEDVDAMKALKRKFQKINFEKQLGSCLLKGRVYDEEGNKTSLQNDQDVKLTEGTAIEMDESASQDLIQEMFGDMTSNLLGDLISPKFGRFYNKFFRWILRCLKNSFSLASLGKARVAAMKDKPENGSK